MKLPVRYQAAILQNHRILLLKVWDHAFTGQTFWVIPGGGRHPGEVEEECVRREAREETHLEVKIERLLIDEVAHPEDMYLRTKTYLCRVAGGELEPGLEPEVDTEDRRTITETGWFDLRAPETWDPLILDSGITLQTLRKLQSVLGYAGDQ